VTHNRCVFNTLFQDSPDPMWLFDTAARTVFDCNPAAVTLVGASSKEQLLQMARESIEPSWQPHRPPEGRPALENSHATGKKGYRFEWVIRRLDGKAIHLEVSATQVTTDARSIEVLVGREVSERTGPASGSPESEEKFRELFEACADAISILDPQTQEHIACNDAGVKLAAEGDTTWFRAQNGGVAAPERQDGRFCKQAAQAWMERALAHGTQRFEWVERRFTGEELPMELLLTPMRYRGSVLLIAVARDISERKKAERELLELNQSLERRVEERTAALTTSEARFRALVEHAPEAIVVFDGLTGRILFGNELACALYGVPMEKLTELTVADVSPDIQPNGRRSSELAREKMDEALAGGTPVFEWFHRRPDDQLVPTEVRLLRLPAEGQNLIRASIIDNTENKRAQRALRESEEKFRALFEGSSQGVLLHDETQILEVNPAAVRILGCQSAQELVGRHPCDTSQPFQPNGESSAALARKYIQECMANGSARFEWISRTPQDKEIPLEVAMTRIQWSGRQVIQAFVNDISERKKAEVELRASEARLRESEARFSAAFHASPIITAIFRASDARFVLVNDAFLSWAGYSREEVLGRTTIDLGIWENPTERDRFWADVRPAGSVRERECRLRNRHGRVSTMLASGVIIEINGMDHLLAMMVDISQRKAAEAELHRTLAREMELSQLKSNFVSMVSHEFRTPLGIIQSSAELLRDFYQKMLPGDRNEYLESISRSTCRMAGMMEEILILSRLEAGKMDFQPTPLNLDRFCRRLVDEVLSATNRRCLIELAVGSVPPQVEADERLLGHIFTNLLSNAVKYSEPGAVVRFAVEQESNHVTCTVRDQGIGIPGEDQQHLFKAFHRGANVGTRPGTGLGLLMVKRCVELHRGNVRLASKLGEGTTVTVRLPVLTKEL